MGNAGPFKSNAENLRKMKIIRYDMGRSVVSRYKNLVRGCDKRCYVSTFGLLNKKGNTTFWNLSKPHLLKIKIFEIPLLCCVKNSANEFNPSSWI